MNIDPAWVQIMPIGANGRQEKAPATVGGRYRCT